MRAILALGSNMGNRQEYLKRAIEELEKRCGRITKTSSILETKAYGYTEQDDFLNMALCLETELAPHELLAELNAIEADLGRVREIHWGPRTIDLDIIYYEDFIVEDERLTIPHADLHNRDFVLKPVCEIAGDYFDPKRKKTVRELLEALS